MSKYSPTKFFYVRKDADETMAFPVDAIRSFTLTIKSGTADDVMKSLGDLFYNHQGGPIIKVADSVDSVFVDSNITAVASITLAS